MSDTNETITDIIAEMRQGMNPNGTAECQYLESDICMLADRLEAAHKRECGNAAKLREALAELVANIQMRSSNFGLNVMVDTKTYLDAKAALADTSNQNTQED